jgi:hypothetical protein
MSTIKNVKQTQLDQGLPPSVASLIDRARCCFSTLYQSRQWSAQPFADDDVRTSDHSIFD